jgi:hypothetical protein
MKMINVCCFEMVIKIINVKFYFFKSRCRKKNQQEIKNYNRKGKPIAIAINMHCLCEKFKTLRNQ